MVTQENKIMAVLSYIGILVLVPIFAVKDSEFVKFHANQGLVLFIVEIAYGILSNILLKILYHVFPLGYVLLGIISGLPYIAFLVLAIIGIVNAYKEEIKELPVIGSIRILK